MIAPLEVLLETKREFLEERRLVSVLFADIVGFTALADRADVEVIGDLIREIWQVLDSVIEEHGGRIDKHTGDGVMAIWGAPIARDDDAERAVLAGLGLQKAFKQFSANSKMLEVQQLKLRVGINSGLVLSTYIGAREEYTVIGDTVNVANRIENEAEPEKIWISESTYNLVRGGFVVKNIGPLKLRGKIEQVNIYEVQGRHFQKKRERFLSYGGLVSNFVGRESTLEELELLYGQVQKDQLPQLVLVVGEVGIGKSRLMMEFAKQKESVGEKILLLSGRALSQTDNAPFYLWKSIYYNLFDIKEDEEPEIAQGKLFEGIDSLLGENAQSSNVIDIVDSFGNLLGIPKEKVGTDSKESGIKDSLERMINLLRRWATRNFVILILDDLQWADSGSLDLVIKILESSASPFPLLILAGARPEILHSQPKLVQHSKIHLLKEIKPTPSLIKTAYPDLQEYPEWVLEKIADRSGGNPFFMEELTKSVLGAEYSLEELDDSKQSIDSKLLLPESLKVSLQARIDSLPPEVRGVLLVASVIGRTFWHGAVVAAAKAPIDTTRSLKVTTVDFEQRVDESFTELIRKELVFPKIGGHFSNETQYIFKHMLLREVAYELLPRKFRKQCHRAVAKWLMARAGPDFYYAIGEHFERGKDFINARTYYGLAAVHAQSKGVAEEYDSIMKKIEAVLRFEEGG
jgi:class 3 adenylate cyclase